MPIFINSTQINSWHILGVHKEHLKAHIKKTTFLLFLLLGMAAFAQQGDKKDIYLRGCYNYGFIMQHRNNMGQLVNGFIKGFELNFFKPTPGNQLWHYENNFPERGLGFVFFDLDNPKQLGPLFAGFCFYEIPLNKIPRPFRLYMRLAPGIAYSPVYFDPIENHKNNVLSSPFSAYVNFKWFFRWDISSRLRWEGGLNFSHASNGRATVPNLGINMVTLNSGFTYKFLAKEKTPVTTIDSSAKRVAKQEILLWAGLGANQVDVMGRVYIAQNYSGTFYYNRRNTHKFGAGIEICYNPANLAILKEDSVRLSSDLQNTQLGVKLAYSYNAGRLSFPVEMGYLVYSKFTNDGMFFHRIGMRYYLKNNFVALITLKTHWAIANYFEFGAGYRIPIKKKNYATAN